MAKIVLRPLEDIASKWAEVTPGRAAYYEAGVKNPRRPWDASALAAAPTYKSAVQNPNIDKLFAGGIKRAGNEKWQRKALNLGVSRYGPGVSAAKDDFAKGFAPFHDELARIELPVKKPRGSSENIERVKKIADALHKKRLALMAVTGGT